MWINRNEFDALNERLTDAEERIKGFENEYCRARVYAIESKDYPYDERFVEDNGRIYTGTVGVGRLIRLLLTHLKLTVTQTPSAEAKYELVKAK